MKTKHTPGPWIAVNRSVRTSKSNEEKTRPFNTAPTGYEGGICNCLGTGYGGSKSDPINKRAVANAHLIAAAPDLLAACKAALDGMQGGYGSGDLAEVHAATNKVESMLEDAIAKAEATK